MVLANLTGINVNLLIIIMGVIAIIYSYTGGLKSVLWTDFIQGSVLLIGVTFALIFLVCGIDGGFGSIMHTFTAEHKFLAEDQPLFNPNILKDSVFYLIGTGLYVFYGQNPELAQTAQQDQIFASYIAYQLPVGITGTLLAAIYAAAQSTLLTGLNSIATSWTLDIQERLSKKEMSFKLQTRIAQYVSLGVGIPASIISRKIKGDRSVPDANTTIFKSK